MLLIKLAKIITSLAISILLFYMLAVSKFDIVSEGAGVLSINDSNINISSPTSGIIKDIDVTSGDEVNIGTQLLTISNIEDENKRDLLDFNFNFYNEQIKKLTFEISELKKTIKTGKPKQDTKSITSTKLLQVNNKYNTYLQKKKELTDKEKSVSLKGDSLKDQESILNKKSNMIKKSLGNTVRYLDSKLEVEKIKFQELENKLLIEEAKSLVDTSYLEFIQLVLELTEQSETDLKKNRESLATTSSERNTVNERIQSTDIISTVHGTVLSLKEGLSEGVYIERNAEILTLKREDDGIYIAGKFDSKFRPYLGINEIVKVKINAPGIKDYFFGKIVGISVDSFDYEEYAKEGTRYYKVKIIFDTNKTQNIKRLTVLLGIQTTIYAVNDKMTFLEYIFSTFNKDLDFTVW